MWVDLKLAAITTKQLMGAVCSLSSLLPPLLYQKGSISLPHDEATPSCTPQTQPASKAAGAMTLTLRDPPDGSGSRLLLLSLHACLSG